MLHKIIGIAEEGLLLPHVHRRLREALGSNRGLTLGGGGTLKGLLMACSTECFPPFTRSINESNRNCKNEGKCSEYMLFYD